MRKIPLILGVLLIVLSVAALVAGRISYATQQEVMNAGPLQARVETRRIIPIPRVLSGLVLVSGLMLVYLGWKKS